MTAGSDTPEALMDVDRAFVRATAANGVDGWVSYFAEDGSMVGGNLVTTGADSIRALLTPVFGDPTYSLQWEPLQAEVASSGDMGYTLGRYLRTRTDADGNIFRAGGSYVTVWRKDADGTWKAVLDVASPDQMPPGGSGN
jgi:ketosteroid isomerase-like protein